jgi:hypothetical protein
MKISKIRTNSGSIAGEGNGVTAPSLQGEVRSRYNLLKRQNLQIGRHGLKKRLKVWGRRHRRFFLEAFYPRADPRNGKKILFFPNRFPSGVPMETGGAVYSGGFFPRDH